MSRELIEELRNTFDYHEDGYLIRKSTGEPCGLTANRPDGRAHVGVGKKVLLAHRVIYAIVYGEMPGEIDHIDQNPLNNRIKNLRDVSKSENQHNSKMYEVNTSGFAGVSWHAQRRKWEANINVDNRRIYLGLFEDFNDAVRARKMAKIRYHPTSPEAFKFALELFPCGGV